MSSTTNSADKKTVKKGAAKKAEPKAAASVEVAEKKEKKPSLGMKHGKFLDYGFYMLNHVKEQLGDAFDLDAALEAAHTYDENWEDQHQFVDQFMNTQKDVRKSKRDHRQVMKKEAKKAEREAAKEAKKAERDAERQAKKEAAKEEREAKKAAEKAAKEAEKAAGTPVLAESADAPKKKASPKKKAAAKKESTE